MFSDYVYNWLCICLDYGITEADFWNMTIAELERAIESKKRTELARLREKANYDYLLADLIGYSVARTQSNKNKMPDISAVYPTLFDSEEIKAQKAAVKQKLSVERFKAFAKTHNDKKKKGANVN